MSAEQGPQPNHEPLPEEDLAVFDPVAETSRLQAKRNAEIAAAKAEQLRVQKETERRTAREDAYNKAYQDTRESQGIPSRSTVGRTSSQKDLHPFAKERFATQDRTDWFAPQEGADLFTVEAEAAGDRAVARVDRGYAFQDARDADDWNATRNVLDGAWAAGFKSGDMTEFENYFQALRSGEKDAYVQYYTARDRARTEAGTKSFDEHVNDALNMANEVPVPDQSNKAPGQEAPEPADGKDGEQRTDNQIDQTKAKETTEPTTSETTKPDESGRTDSEATDDTDDGLTPAMREANKLRTQLEASWREAALKRAQLRETNPPKPVVLKKRLQDRMRTPEQIAQLLGASGERNLANARRERAEQADPTASDETTAESRNQGGRIKRGARSVFGRIRGAASRVRASMTRGGQVADDPERLAALDRATRKMVEDAQTARESGTQASPELISLDERRRQQAERFANSQLGQQRGRGANDQSNRRAA